MTDAPDSERCRWIEETLLRLARERGLNGSPHRAEDAQLMPQADEWDAVDLSLSFPRAGLSPGEKQLIRRWARNIVASSTAEPVVHVNSPARPRAW
jgi:hypothetical protein